MLPQAPIESIAIAYKDMDEKKRAEMNQVVTHIIAGDGKLWALNQYSGKFGEITENGVEYTHDFDLRNLSPELRYDEDYRFPGFVYKNTLYLFSVMKKEMFFAKYNLKGNEREDAPLAKSMGVAYPYNETHALYVADIQIGQNTGGYAETIYMLDLVTGDLTPAKLDFPEEIAKNTMIYIKGIYQINSDSDLYCVVESGGGVSTNNRILVFDKNGSLKRNVLLPQAKSGFYYLCQPLDSEKVIAVDAFGAFVFDMN